MKAERLDEIERRLDALGASLSEDVIRELIAAVREKDARIAELEGKAAE